MQWCAIAPDSNGDIGDGDNNDNNNDNNNDVDNGNHTDNGAVVSDENTGRNLGRSGAGT